MNKVEGNQFYVMTVQMLLEEELNKHSFGGRERIVPSVFEKGTKQYRLKG
jgi:hypothetical protein